MLDNNSGSNGTGGGTGRRRSTFYVALAENSNTNNGTANSDNKETPEKTNTIRTTPSKKLSTSSQTLTIIESEKSVQPRRSSTSKTSSHALSSKSPSKSPSTKIVPKPSPLHAPQPLKACTRTIQGPQLLKLGPPQSPRTPKKSSSLLHLSTKSPSQNLDSPQKTGKPLQLSLSLRRTPSTKPVVLTARDSPKATSTPKINNFAQSSSVNVEPKKIPVVVIEQHDGDQDTKTGDSREGQYSTPLLCKEIAEDESGVHSGK
ncbi:hypothetical protein C0J52_14360 [Blattella germanica]|nr:hypothetical protein C0J52_14360 [Blattella germanica]